MIIRYRFILEGRNTLKQIELYDLDIEGETFSECQNIAEAQAEQIAMAVHFYHVRFERINLLNKMPDYVNAAYYFDTYYAKKYGYIRPENRSIDYYSRPENR